MIGYTEMGERIAQERERDIGARMGRNLERIYSMEKQARGEEIVFASDDLGEIESCIGRIRALAANGRMGSTEAARAALLDIQGELNVLGELLQNGVADTGD